MTGACSPEISVIVPVRDGAESLPALLASLDAQTLTRDRFEVIVVDNASTDGTADVAVGLGARLVSEPIPGRARARNRGARAAKARLHVCTDADCVAEPNWLEALLDCAGRAPLVAGNVKTRVRDAPNAIERFELQWRFAQEAWVMQGWAATANLLVHATAFEAIGGFDTAYRHYGEDADFCLRAGKAGFHLGYCADAVVEHQGDDRLWPFLRRGFMHGYGSDQAFHRIGTGYRAWRDPWPVLRGDLALRRLGLSPDGFAPGESESMSRLARVSYAARVVGSLWAEAVRAR
jgi:GT2 family glycosyltransferase